MPYDRASRTRVLGMTFRPGPSPLGGPHPRNSTKDGGERGQNPEKTSARTRGKGTTPGFEGQAGSYIMAQKGTVEAVTSGSHFGQSLHGGHFTPVASLSRPLPVCPCYKCSPLTLFDTAPATAAVWSPPLATSPQCECYGSLLYPSLPPPPPPVIRPADHALPVLKFRSKSKLQVRAEDGIYHLVPSVQAGTRDHR